jgi:hypothetical protein
MTAGTPVHATSFFHDGRGPELRRAHWNAAGTALLAIEYVNPGQAMFYDQLFDVIAEGIEIIDGAFAEGRQSRDA